MDISFIENGVERVFRAVGKNCAVKGCTLEVFDPSRGYNDIRVFSSRNAAIEEKRAAVAVISAFELGARNVTRFGRIAREQGLNAAKKAVIRALAAENLKEVN